MKPQYLFGMIAALLCGGTLFSRYADAGQIPQDMANSMDLTPAGATACINKADVRILRLSGETAFGAGELPALNRIEQSLRTAPEAAVAVEWVESYRQHRVVRRACYLPEQQTLLCTSGTRVSYTYQPVSRAGIEASLRDTNDAPFANANLYSLPHSAQP